jgi:putative NADH-flavin reductase
VARKLLILGATGATGRHVLAKATAAAMDVTVLVRDPSKLSGLPQPSRIVTGSVTGDGSALADAMVEQDAVISTLGRRSSLNGDGLFTLGMPLIVRTMETAGVRRLIVTSAFGVGATRVNMPWLPRFLAATMLRSLYADKEQGDKAIRASHLDWTIVYPSGLTNAPGTSEYRVGEQLPLRGFPTISRADLADFLLRLIGDETYIRKGVMISS